MHLAVSASHRAFVGVALTVMTVLVVGLAIGWRWHFRVVEGRRHVMEMTQKIESQRARYQVAINTASRSPALVPSKSAATAPKSARAEWVYDEHAPAVPERALMEALPLVNAGALLREAASVVNRYTQAKDWQDRVQFVHDADHVRPRMEQFYEEQKGRDPNLGALIDQARYGLHGTEVILLTYRRADASGRVEVALRPNATGGFALDWESLVGYSQVSWAEFSHTKMTQPRLLRTWVSLDQSRTGISPNQLALILRAAHGPESRQAFCPRESELGRWLESELGDPQAPEGVSKAYTLWVIQEEGESGQDLKLLQVVAPRWLLLP